MRCSCVHLSVVEALGWAKAAKFEGMIHPLDLDIGLERGAAYLVFGVVVRSGVVWLYVFPERGDPELTLVPAVLFKFVDPELQAGMLFRESSEGPDSFELVPEIVASCSNWFERYVNEDEEILALVCQEVQRLIALNDARDS